MTFLVDTNVLLRSVEPAHPQHSVAVNAVAKLLDRGHFGCFTFQNIAEFWNVATRPRDRNGLGYSLAAVRAEVEKIESLFNLLSDSPASYEEWKRLLVRYRVAGVKVHDARLVAAMRTAEVTTLLTFNVDDFVRYEDITVIHPTSVLA